MAEDLNQHSTILTGIKPTGTPHVGNYLGAIKPALENAKNYSNAYFFIANYHALNSIQSAEDMHDLTRSIAATWIAAGLNPHETHLYRQSDIPEIFELETILNTFVPKGWMNKMHAYKAAVDQNHANSKTDDEGINMGLYTYPILMTADILMFQATHVPVGRDQAQHVEIARDVAQRFNNHYETEVLTLPNHVINETVQEIPGLDGRKMSKSYGNILPLFGNEEIWTDIVKKIVTDNTEHTDETFRDTTFYKIYSQIASDVETDRLVNDFVINHIGWKVAKDKLIEALIVSYGSMSEQYFELINQPDKIDQILREGAEAVRPIARENLDKIKQVIGTN